MRVIDTHVQDVAIPQNVPVHQTLGGLAPVASRDRQADVASLTDLILDMDRAGVTTSLVVIHEDAGRLLRPAAEHPGRLFGLAYFDSLNPHEGLEQVRALCEDHPGEILGVATALPLYRQDPRLRDFAPLYEYCALRDLPVQFLLPGGAAAVETGRFTAFGVLATTYPRLKIVCLESGAGGFPDLPRLVRKLPNLFLVAQGHGPQAGGEDGSPWRLRELLRAAGSRKVMFGSHWTGRDRTYHQRVEAVRRLPWWQRAHVGWRTAVRVYGPQLLGGRKLETGNWKLEKGRGPR
jgi:predicted TIM-barrel fold metal-dependent hydrolase